MSNENGQGCVEIKCGAIRNNFDAIGRTLKSIAENKILITLLNIDPSSSVFVNGEDMSNNMDYKLRQGDMVEFIKAAGSKGC